MDTVLVQRGDWPGWADADIYLEPEAAYAYLTARRDYVTAMRRNDAQIAEPVGGLRTLTQVKLMQIAFDSRNPNQMHYWNMDPNSTARPGLNSPHLSGRAMDVWAGTNQSWIDGTNWWIVNGPRYGLHQTLRAQRDFHHLEYKPGTETQALDVRSLDEGSGTTPNPTAPPVPKEDDDMKDHMLLEHSNADGSTQWLLVSPTLESAVDIWKVDTANALSKRIAMAFNATLTGSDITPLEGAIIVVSAAEFNNFRAAAAMPALKTPVTDKP